MPELAIALPIAHVAHWSHLLLYLVPVIAVLVAILMSAAKTRRLDAERERGGADGPEEDGRGGG